MVKLKTLKDLESYAKRDNIGNIPELWIKAEAIKRWKYYGGAISSGDWLDFFNITEEDLK